MFLTSRYHSAFTMRPLISGCARRVSTRLKISLVDVPAGMLPAMETRCSAISRRMSSAERIFVVMARAFYPWGVVSGFPDDHSAPTDGPSSIRGMREGVKHAAA